jgi:ketosteroid isomerase-like protein
MKEEVIAAFDGLYEALLKRGDPEDAVSLFADGDVVFWGSGREEQALGRPALTELFGAIAEIGHTLSFDWSHRQVGVEGDAAWVSAIGHFTHTPADGPPQRGPYRVTAVFVRRGGRWLWHTYSGSEPVD